MYSWFVVEYKDGEKLKEYRALDKRSAQDYARELEAERPESFFVVEPRIRLW